MKIVIDIDEETYKSIQDNDYCGISNGDMYNAIKNGTPLSTDGDLISKKQAIETWQNLDYIKTDSQLERAKELLNLVPTIQPSGDLISRQAVIEVLNKMDRYVADELTLCDAERKFPKNEVFIVDDVYEEIAERLSSVTPQPKEESEGEE